VGGQRPILAPLHRNLEGHSPSLPYSLFHPWYWSMLNFFYSWSVGYVEKSAGYKEFSRVDRGVLQAMWEELAGIVALRDQLIIC